jgi:RimJ/RimL family protein N-acetyltransferase
MEGLGRDPVSTVELVRTMIEGLITGWRTEGLGPFIFETAGTDQQVVGQAGVMIFDTRGWTASTWAEAGSHAQPELGWALIRAHWGQGYATEGAAAIREWAYEKRSIEQLVSRISSDNPRSQRVAARLGAVPTETVTPWIRAGRPSSGGIRPPLDSTGAPRDPRGPERVRQSEFARHKPNRSSGDIPAHWPSRAACLMSLIRLLPDWG